MFSERRRGSTSGTWHSQCAGGGARRCWGRRAWRRGGIHRGKLCARCFRWRKRNGCLRFALVTGLHGVEHHGRRSRWRQRRHGIAEIEVARSSAGQLVRRGGRGDRARGALGLHRVEARQCHRALRLREGIRLDLRRTRRWDRRDLRGCRRQWLQRRSVEIEVDRLRCLRVERRARRRRRQRAWQRDGRCGQGSGGRRQRGAS
jgi:hypothetical protein